MSQTLKISLTEKGLIYTPYPYGTDISSLDANFVKMTEAVFYDMLLNDSQNRKEILDAYYSSPTADVQNLQNKISNDGSSGAMNNTVQIDMEGNTLAFDNNATFSETKEECKSLLGGVEKINDRMILAADSVNKRVFISDIFTGKVIWEYNSDRYVIDARMIKSDDGISITNDVVEYKNFIRANQDVVFTNNTDANITIYSGRTTLSEFTADPDLTMYGDQFISPELAVGERYSHKFLQDDTYYWFTYPNIQTGTIYSTNSINVGNYFAVVESDTLNSPFSARVIKVDIFGNIVWQFGNGYISNPKDIRVLLNKFILSI